MCSTKFQPVYIIIAVLMISSIACSNGNSVVSPAVENTDGISQELPIAPVEGNSNRSLLAVYDAVIDPVKQTFTIEPSTRDLSYHGALTRLYPNVLTIDDYGWSPNFWVDITLTHPLPGSGIIIFDPRVIAILPANPGVSFNYPVLDCVGNNSVVLEPDGYTKLHDSIGGPIPGNTNPFKAYFKDQPNRRWMDTGVTSETQRWQMNFSGMPIPLQYKLVVDISTNYPQLPTPGVDNAPEPVEIDASVGPGLTSFGGEADITVTLLNWHDHSDIGGVLVESPDLFVGTIDLAYTSTGPNRDEYIYSGTITNSLLPPAGTLKIILAAWDQATGIYIYKEFPVSVSFLSDKGMLVWVKPGSGGWIDGGRAITTLSDNSIVMIGYIGGNTNIIISRYDPYGTLEWEKVVGGFGSDYGNGIASLSDDSVVVTGTFRGTVTFGPGEPNETVLTAGTYSYDLFVARYNADGTLAWAKRAGGTSTVEGKAITVLSDNSSVVTGYFRDSTVIFGEGEPNETILHTDWYEEMFIARYDPDGMLLWVKQTRTNESAIGYGITALSDNSTVVTGGITSFCVFGYDEINETTLSGGSSSEMFIAKYDPDGMLQWAKQSQGAGNNVGYGISVLPDNTTVLTGCFSGTATFGYYQPNPIVLTSLGDNSDIFIARYGAYGTALQAKQVASGEGEDIGMCITTLSDYSVVVSGYFTDSATFGPSELNETILTSAGALDIFIARYNPDVTLAWAKRAGGSQADQGLGITTLSDDSTVLTGLFRSSATFGPGEPNETILTAFNFSDIFVARFEP